MLYLDTETYSTTPIKHGGYRYTADCEAMLVTYALDDGPVQLWDATESMLMPNDLSDALEDQSVIITAHNSNFDRNVLKHALGFDITIERFRCTMMRAMLHGLPGGLDKLSDIFKLGDKAKDKKGHALLMMFCKPNKHGGRNTRETHPEEWDGFKRYAVHDIIAMRELDRLLPKWNCSASELSYWYLDQRSNDRGVAIDTGLAEGALRAVNKEQRALKQRTRDLTNEELESTTKRDKMLEYMLEAYGVSLPDLQMATIERRLADPDLPIELKELLNIRLQASTTSTSKYTAMLKAVNDDGRVRGLIQFCGAIRTGRDAGRTVQPQNFPSRDLMPMADIENGIVLLQNDAADLVYDNVMKLTSSCLRQTLIAAPGKKLIAADLSNIEGRYLAWAAGEEWKVQAFRDFDTGEGHDLYVLAYSRAFRMEPEGVTKAERQIGKVMELALGFAGGVGAFLTFAAGYNLDLDNLAEVAYTSLPEDIRKEAEGFYEWTVKQKRSTFGLPPQVFVTCESFKRLWREAHPQIVGLWDGLESIVRQAVTQTGQTFTFGKFKARRDGQWLRLVMPSGRALCYPYPQVDDKGQISFMGVDQYTRKWQRIKTFGGKLVENCIAEGTLVLTDKGWLAIEHVTEEHLIWDGLAFVENSGCIHKGNQVVLSVFGVAMTPEHKVLTEKGWRSASSCQGYNRATCRLPSSFTPHRELQKRCLMGDSLRLWKNCFSTCKRTYEMVKERGRAILRVYAKTHDRKKTNNARDVKAPRLFCLAEYGRPLSATYTSGLAQLWGEGYSSLRRMANKLREFLGRYGAFIPTWADYRTHRQYGELYKEQLPVAHNETSSEQQADKCILQHTRGETIRCTGGGLLWCEKDDIPVQNSAGVAATQSVKPVYDIVNCGPRSRFVVQGEDGGLLIVHNCTQAGARDVFKHGALLADQAGYELVFPVHDENVTETPDTEEFSAEGLVDCMTVVPPWATGLPLAAEGFEAYRYRK